MKKMYCIKFNKFKKFKKLWIYVFDKTLVLCIICGKCGSNYEKVFREKG